ncbi:tRNA ligase, partial [Bonamia ostreae]
MLKIKNLAKHSKMDIRSFFSNNNSKKAFKTKAKTKFAKNKKAKTTLTKNSFLDEKTIVSDSVKTAIKKSCDKWKDNGVPFSAFCDALDKIEKISGRLKSIEIMSSLYAKVIKSSPKDLIPIVYLTTNQVAPPYENKETGVGDGIMYKVVEQVTGRKIKQDIRKSGDLALIAEKYKSEQKLLSKPAALTCFKVFKLLRSLADLEGSKVWLIF